MLQSEFFERTHITLTSEEYADVERLYNSVKMNKDEFCKHWVAEKKNPLFKELADAYRNEFDKHLSDVRQLTDMLNSLKEDFNAYKKQATEAYNTLSKTETKKHIEFAKRIVRSNAQDERELLVQDVVEEEFGFDFIIKTKFEAGLTLSNDEIAYMVGKL